MNLLGIDTAAERFSVALAAGGGTWLFEADAGRRHSELVMDCVDTLMRQAGLKPADLDGAVCMGGPGSFTGLRIGFSIAKGLALSLGIPFAAVPTLDCMARPFSAWPGLVAPLIDAKKGAFFCALYRGGRRLCPDMDAPPAEIAAALSACAGGQKEPALLVGPGAALLYEKLGAADIKPALAMGAGLRWGNAETLLRIAEETRMMDAPPDYSAGPEYIRKSDAEIELGKR